MRFINLVARPHPAGNRIDVSWVHPNPAQFPGVRVVRRAGAFPLSPVPASDHEGVVVADTNPIPRRPNPIVVRADGTYATSDTELKGETVYYYALFPYAGNPPNYDLDRRNRAAAMATAPYDFAGQMADLLPALYHRLDTPVTSTTGVVGPNRSTGQLRAFLDLPGTQLDLLYSFARGLRGLRDVENVDSRLLLLLAQWIGWRIDLRRDSDLQRNDIRNAPHVYRTVGVTPALEAAVKRLVGWESRTKEFVHNVFRSNQPERLNLWVREQTANGTWTTPSAPLSLDFAYEGRPAAVRDPEGTLWLFYHTLRKGRWDIWYKTLREGKAWEPSAPLSNGALIEMHPTAALQAAKLLVFWNAYNQTAGRWQINFRTHLNGRWSPIALLSALAPFASDEIARRLPSAVTDNTGMLWLFWLELEGGRWQLRYNRYDGTAWALPAAAAFPLDGGADPRVEGAPFLMFHPTDRRQPLWVFWARREPASKPGPQRWRIVYRVKATLDPRAMDWSAIRALPPGPADTEDREPAAMVKANGEVELFWSANRNGSRSILRATVNLTSHVWTIPELLTRSPHSQSDPLPVSLGSSAMLLYRANDGVKYASALYSATETVDNRYAGSTTVDMRNTAKRALWGTFDDFQAFTSDVRIDLERPRGRVYAREAVGLWLSPTTSDRGEIQRNQSLLQSALGEFLPAQVRAVFRIETT
jgi:hypothetical protein